MAHYRKYTTTVVGAHSVPRWYEALDRLVGLGQISPADFADAEFRATQAAILEQEVAGIDVITGGEMHRRTHNRHWAPNSMLNRFGQKMPASKGVTRPKPISRHDPNVFNPAATCRGPIAETTDLGLVDEFRTVSAFARKPVKVTMTGPHLLAAVAYDEHYHDPRRMMSDLGKLLHQNFKRLAAAGCKHIQVDEPYFTVADDDEVRAAVDAINIAIEGLAVDVQAPNIETGEQVAERIRAQRWLAPEQTIITSTCGFNHLPRHIALGKLRAMTEAKAIMGGVWE